MAQEHHFHVDPDDPQAVAYMEDLATYASVVLTIGFHPDNPEALANTIHIGDGAPCYLLVAEVLRGIADQFDFKHDTESGCPDAT